MPWCPKCGAEYVENVRKCKDCDVRLLDHKPTPDEMLSSYKWPRIYNIVDSLPHTATGKIMHRALRKQK